MKFFKGKIAVGMRWMLPCILALLIQSFSGIAQELLTTSPPRKEGEGPWKQFIIRGATIIDGTLAPPVGPVDIVIENNRIKSIHLVGAVGSSAFSKNSPKLQEGGKELDARGMYILPGFFDTHQHIGDNAEYTFKLDLAHGITSIRDPGCGNGLNWVADLRKKSKTNEILAPRIKAYLRFGFDADGKFNLPTNEEEARAWIQYAHQAGADGIKDAGFSPEVIKAALDESKKVGLRSMIHHRQTMVGRWNALQSARAGVNSLEHWYGLPESMFTDRKVQDFPEYFNYQNEQNRFAEAGKLWKQTAEPFSEKWNEVMDEMIGLDLAMSPTFAVYEKYRDYMRARTLEWFPEYAFPAKFKRRYYPNRLVHGAALHYWTTQQEGDWRKNYELWMKFINEYKNRGGKVTTGSDEAMLFGFSLIREMELLQEAGFHPLEVINSATLRGAQVLGVDDDLGSIEIGKLADLVIVDGNPIENLKVLYGTGAIKLTDDDEVVRVGGVKYTIKDGILFDAKALLADVKQMVDEEKAKTGEEIVQPGFYHHSQIK